MITEAFMVGLTTSAFVRVVTEHLIVIVEEGWPLTLCTTATSLSLLFGRGVALPLLAAVPPLLTVVLLILCRLGSEPISFLKLASLACVNMVPTLPLRSRALILDVDGHVSASQQNVKKRSFAICPEGWSVPICLPEEVRADTASLFACDDEALAHSIWAKCKGSSKAIGLLAPRDLKVGLKTPSSYLVPFFEHVEGMPSRKIDLQVWLHQLSTADVTFASPRQVVDMGHVSKKTSVFRARLDNRVSANYRADFAKGNKAIMKAALTPVLGDVGLSKVLDLWSPKLDSNGQFTFFIRALSSDKDDLLRLSRPDKLILDTPIEDAARFKHVWLKAEGAPMSSSEVERLLATTTHLGAFSKQGTWALRVLEDQFADIKKALGQNSLPAYLLIGLPADYVPEQVEEFCTKLGWAVQVDPLSRRFRNKRLQWIVRASSLPPVHSTYCFTGYNRLRIDIESAVRQPITAPPPRVDLNDFQTTTFAQQTARARPKIGPGRVASNGGVAPTYAQALIGSSPSPSKPPTKRHKSNIAAAGDATPHGGLGTVAATSAFQSSPPRRFQTTSSPSSTSEMATLGARLAHTLRRSWLKCMLCLPKLWTDLSPRPLLRQSLTLMPIWLVELREGRMSFLTSSLDFFAVTVYCIMPFVALAQLTGTATSTHFM